MRFNKNLNFQDHGVKNDHILCLAFKKKSRENTNLFSKSIHEIIAKHQQSDCAKGWFYLM
jgi:hypothetical protein